MSDFLLVSATQPRDVDVAVASTAGDIPRYSELKEGASDDLPGVAIDTAIDKPSECKREPSIEAGTTTDAIETTSTGCLIGCARIDKSTSIVGNSWGTRLHR